MAAAMFVGLTLTLRLGAALRTVTFKVTYIRSCALVSKTQNRRYVQSHVDSQLRLRKVVSKTGPSAE